jgi:hypothetical protein
VGLLSSLAVQASPTCPDEQASPQVAPTDPAFCKRLVSRSRRFGVSTRA